MGAALEGSPGAAWELEKYRKGGDALAGLWRVLGSSLGGQSGEGHWRQRKGDKAWQVWGTARNSAQAGRRSVCSGEEEEEGERRQGWRRRWGSIMRALQ